MTDGDLFIFTKNGWGERSPAWVGWKTTTIYGNAGFMRGKSRSNLGPAKWPLSISVNHSLAPSGRQWQSWDFFRSQLSSSANQRPQAWRSTLPGRQGFLIWEMGHKATAVPQSLHSPCPLPVLSAFALGFPAPGSKLKFLYNWQGVRCGIWGPGLQVAPIPRD